MWSDLKKTNQNGSEYANIGNRFYTRHAVDRMTPKNFGTAVGGSEGRSVPTMVVEATIKAGEKIKTEATANGIIRETWKIGNVEVITENSKKIVVTVMTK